MKQFWRKFLTLAIEIILLLMLASCSLHGQTQQKDNQTEDKTKVRIAWWGTQSRHDNIKKLLEIYEEEHTNIEFDLIPMSWEEYFDWLSIQAMSGAMPDIIQMDYMYLSTYAKNGSLAELQEFIDKGTLNTKYINQKYVDAGRVDGKLIGMPLGKSTLAVGYNPEVFHKAGVEEPDSNWTWDDYIEKNRQIAKKTGNVSAIVAVGVTGDINLFHYWVRQHGKNLFNEKGNGLGYEDDTILADYLNMWKSMMDENISPNPDEMAEILTLSWKTNPVVAGNAGTIFEWGNYAVKMAAINNNLKMVTPPLKEQYGQKGLWIKPSMFFSIAENSEVKEICAEFINWFLNSEEANDIVRGEQGIPVSSKILEHLYNSGMLTPQQKNMFEYFEEAEKLSGDSPPPDPIGISTINEVFTEIGNAVFYEQMTAEEGAEEFRTKVEKILKETMPSER